MKCVTCFKLAIPLYEFLKTTKSFFLIFKLKYLTYDNKRHIWDDIVFHALILKA